VLKWNGSAWVPQVSGTNQPLYGVWSSNNKVWAVGQNGTIITSSNQIIVDAVSPLLPQNAQIFPNPTNGHIQWKNLSADQVQVFNQTGQLALEAIPAASELDISSLPVGIYFFKITSGNQVYSAQIIKQ
jgi:hypothetical protein